MRRSNDDDLLRAAFDPTRAVSADPYQCKGPNQANEADELALFKMKACPKEFQTVVLQHLSERYGIGDHTYKTSTVGEGEGRPQKEYKGDVA